MAEPVAVPDDVADPARFVLAACDLRTARINAATPGPYKALSLHTIDGVDWHVHAGPSGAVWLYVGSGEQDRADAVHIAAEANPRHALAEVALWRLIATKHRAEAGMFPPVCTACAPTVEYDEDTDGETEFLPLAPCELLIAVVAAARAYLTGTGG